MGSNSMVKLMCREEDSCLEVNIDQLPPSIHISLVEHLAPGNESVFHGLHLTDGWSHEIFILGHSSDFR